MNICTKLLINNSEIDFLLQNGMEIIPVEVKAGEAAHAKSLKNIYLTKIQRKHFDIPD